MKLISMSVKLFIYLFSLIHTFQLGKSEKSGESSKDIDVFNLTTVEIIQKYGYPAEVHTTVTEDGYILELHRVPHGKNSTKPGFPILLTHGIFYDSAAFFLLGEKSLGFFLADEGYDVWSANFRGTHYTRTHKNLSADDSKFWDFSFHELGIYDLPAQIDYICNNTKSPDLLFLGHSMGSTTFFILGSERPEYQKKIRGAALLGPVAALKYSYAAFQFALIPMSSFITSVSKPHLIGAENEDSGILQNFMKFMCNSTKIQRRICSYGVFALGVDPEGFDERTVLNLITHVSGTSTKVLDHFAQLFLTSRFQQYDYGKVKNLVVYKSVLPPEYHLERLTTPISLFLGKNDVFVTPENIFETFKNVHSLKSIYVVPEKYFTHYDFIAGKHNSEILYPEIARRLKDFISSGKDCHKKL